MGKRKEKKAKLQASQMQNAEELEIQRAFEQGITTLRDLISPSSIEIHSSYFRLGTKYGRTLYIWLSTFSLYRLAFSNYQY